MSGVVVDVANPPPGATGPWDLEPLLSPSGIELVDWLQRRHRPLIGGQVVTVGKFKPPSAVRTSSTYTTVTYTKDVSIQASFGTLGLLLEDDADEHVGYALSALHVLEHGATAILGRSVALGDPVFQYGTDISEEPGTQDHIGWVIAVSYELDAALIGLRPTRRWRPEIETRSPLGRIPSQRRPDPLLPLDKPPSAHDPVEADAPRWAPDYPTPIRADLPVNGPEISKTGRRTGRTTGRAYWYARAHSAAAFRQIPKPPSDGKPHPTWDLLRDFYAHIKEPDGASLDLEDDRYNPPRYLCVPESGGADPGLLSFAQKGDSGSVVLDGANNVVGLLCESSQEDGAAPTWLGALVVPIHIVLSHLQEEFDAEFGPDPGGSSKPWPKFVVADAGTLTPRQRERRVPGGIVSAARRPRWYEVVGAKYTLKTSS